MVSEGAYPPKIVGVVATASQGRRGWLVSTGGELGTGAKTLGRLPRRPPAVSAWLAEELQHCLTA
ncbi:hypothetical protein VULLAG_LOCUS16210 [Vulpes lagopus]